MNVPQAGQASGIGWKSKLREVISVYAQVIDPCKYNHTVQHRLDIGLIWVCRRYGSKVWNRGNL